MVEPINITMPDDAITPIEINASDLNTININEDDVVKKRPSNIFKQAAAGVTDIATGIPQVLGAAGAAIEGGYNHLTSDDSNSKFSDQFGKALETGVDSDLMKFGGRGREKVNNFFDIKDPVSTEDQIARLVGGFIPIPGFALVSGAGKLANIAKGTANVLLPTVNTAGGLGKTAIRGGIQLGIGTGADQGMRALADQPLMFSEEAITGEKPSGPAIDIEHKDIITTGVAALREQDALVQKNADKEDVSDWLLIAGSVALAGLGAKKFLYKPAMKSLDDAQNLTDVGNALHTRFVDKATGLEAGLRSIGESEEYIKRATGFAHNNPIDMGIQAADEGNLPLNFKSPSGKQLKSWHELNGMYQALGNNKQTFVDATKASIERVIAHNNAANPALWANTRSVQELDALITAGRSNDDVKALMEAMSDNYETLLEFKRFQGIITDTEFAAQMASSKLPSGQRAFMPLYAAERPLSPNASLSERLSNIGGMLFVDKIGKRYFGIGKSYDPKAEHAAEIAMRGNNVAEHILDPLTAMRRYTINTVAYAREQSFKSHLLDNLSGIVRSRTGAIGRRVTGQGNPARTAHDTQYVGRVSDLSNPDSLAVSVMPNSQLSAAFKDMSLEDMRAKFPGEIVTAHYGGELRIFHVPDKGIRAALELNPQLHPAFEVMNNWKRLATAGTTGNLSPFAPLSSAYSAQQVAINTAAREGLLEGVKSIGRSAKGVGNLMKANMATDIANYLTVRLAKSYGNAPPAVLQRMQHFFARSITRNMLNAARTESGRTATGIGNLSTGTISQVMEKFGKPAMDFFGADEGALVVNLWKSWNNAWHEGPAWGAYLKHTGNILNRNGVLTPKDIRLAVDKSKTLAGDMSRVGSSGAAKAFDASVPFSGAMIQSWNSLGSAAKHDFPKFMLGATALIGAPTISELVYNNSISEGSKAWPDSDGRMWTYNDYLWNGFSSEQRNNNFIYMLPGKPPWEALLVPVSPEWSLFRSVVLDMTDGIFGFSHVGEMGDMNGLQVDQKKVTRSHFMKALTKVFDVPLPPLVSAAFSASGMDIRVGPQMENSQDPENPGKHLSFFNAVPSGSGERVTRRGGMTRLAEGTMHTNTAAIIQDIFGAAGATYVKMYEAYHAQYREGKGTIGAGASSALESLTDSTQHQMRYMQPLFGKMIHPTKSDELNDTMYQIKPVLESLSTQMKNGYMGGGIAYVDGALVEGDTIIPSDDPITLELAASVDGVLDTVRAFDEQINNIKKGLTTIPNATNMGSIKDRKDRTDSIILEMQVIRAQQVAVIQDIEVKLSQYLSERYGRDVDIDLRTYASRPNLAKGSKMPEFLNLPQTPR